MVKVIVLAYSPVTFFHCLHCEMVWQQTGVGEKYRREQLKFCMPDDLKEEYQKVSEWVRGMLQRYAGRLEFRVIDAVSIEGWIMSLRYRVHRYPAVIVNGKEKIVGPDFERASRLIERLLGAPGEPSIAAPARTARSGAH